MSNLASVLRSILQPVLQGWDALLDLVSAAIAPVAPEDIFQAGDIGYVADPSDYTTMFQDSAGTVAVTALGQPVGRVNDKNGSALHMLQSVAPARPELRLELGTPSLYLDGIDDRLTGSFTSPSGYADVSVGVCGIEAGNRTFYGGSKASFVVSDVTGVTAVASYGFTTVGYDYYGYSGFADSDSYTFAQIVDAPVSASEPITVISRAVAGVEMNGRTYQSGWQDTGGAVTGFNGLPAGLVRFSLGYTSFAATSIFGGFWIDRKITDLEAEGVLEYYQQKVV